MEEDHKGCPMIRMGVSGWVFLLVPAYPGCPGPKAVKRLCVSVCVCVLFFSSAFTVLPSSHGDWIDRLRLSPVGFWRGDGESVSVSQTERRISQSIYWIMSPAADSWLAGAPRHAFSMRAHRRNICRPDADTAILRWKYGRRATLRAPPLFSRFRRFVCTLERWNI